MVNSKLLLFYFFLLTHFLSAQNNYIVYFKDKNNSNYSTLNPQAYLSQRAIMRREKCHISIQESDLPVNQNYIQQVQATGAKVIYSLKWLNAVVVNTSSVNIQTIQSLNCIKGTSSSLLKSSSLDILNFYSPTSLLMQQDHASQTELIGLQSMNQKGIYGEGVLIAIFDDGFKKVNTNSCFQYLMNENRIIATYDIVDGSNDVYTKGSGHGSNVLSIMAAQTNNYNAVIPKSNFVLFRTENNSSESKLEEYNWIRALEISDSLGVDIIQSSLGYNTFDNNLNDHSLSQLDGQAVDISKMATEAYKKGLIIINSAGNEGNNGWRKILFPADAQNILAVGAVNSVGERAYFSSTGNTVDSRIKPDLMALGDNALIVDTNNIVKGLSGTSFAAPMITALVAGLLETFPNATHHDICNAILLSCNRYYKPDSLYGYGIPQYTLAVQSYSNLFNTSENQLITRSLLNLIIYI